MLVIWTGVYELGHVFCATDLFLQYVTAVLDVENRSAIFFFSIQTIFTF